jgi:hypothetical protein
MTKKEDPFGALVATSFLHARMVPAFRLATWNQADARLKAGATQAKIGRSLLFFGGIYYDAHDVAHFGRKC